MQPDVRATQNRMSVWIVEDKLDYRESVRRIIDGTDDLMCTREFASAERLLEYLNEHFAPEVVLVDLGLPAMSGIELIRRLRAAAPITPLLVLTIHEDNDHIFDAICAGASGYLLKTAMPDQIVQGIRDVHSGGAPMTKEIARRVLNMFTQRVAPQWDYQLTKRETDVLKGIVDGMTKEQIAKALFLSVHTVDTHFRNIYSKLHVNSRSGAVAKALKERLVRE